MYYPLDISVITTKLNWEHLWILLADKIYKRFFIIKIIRAFTFYAYVYKSQLLKYIEVSEYESKFVLQDKVCGQDWKNKSSLAWKQNLWGQILYLQVFM